MLTGRERIQMLINHKEPDRIGLWDAYWEDTVYRWHSEGLPNDISAQELLDFDFDTLYIDASLRLPEKIIEDNEEYTIREDKHGFVAKQWKGKAGALGYLSHAVNDADTWQRLKPRLQVDVGDTARVGPVSYFEPFTRYPTWDELATVYKQMYRNNRYILLHVYGPFEAAWRRHGYEASLMNLVLNPALMVDMFETHVDLIIGTLQKAAEYDVKPNGLFLVEDMGINTGPMFSPKVYDQLLYPAHRRLGDYLRKSGMCYFIHSDGKINLFIPRLIQAGVDVLQPMEVKAGLDVRELKLEYGNDLTFMGNIDASKMHGAKDEVETEIREKITIAMQNGGYIYHSDHSVPPTVSWERYRWIIEKVKQYGIY